MNSFWNFLKNNKLYGAINLVGLSVSMAFVILLAVYIRRQLSTDSFQQNADRIYCIANDESINMGYWLDKHLKGRFPEIEKGCSVAQMGSSVEFTIEGETVYGSTMAADSSFFEMFSYGFTKGDKADWSLTWDRCAISEAFANAHFGDKDPIGRTIRVRAGEEDSYDLTVCGTYKDFGNSVLQAPDVLVRGEMMTKTNSANDESMSNAGSPVCFVMTYPGTDLRAKHDEMLDYLKDIFWVYKAKNWNDVRIIPLRDMYFLESGQQDWSGTLHFGDRGFVNLLLGMCLILLLFAILNYVNMTTALTGFRAKEMATRRLVGAEKRSIFMKIILESTLVCAVSMALAILLAEAIAPTASRVLDYPLSVFGDLSLGSILAVAGFVVTIGVVAGLVPALLIQKAQPIEIVRGSLKLKTKTVYSKVIIVLQNVVAVAMLVTALTMYLQIRNMVSADLGYNTKDILVVDNVYGKWDELRPLFDRWKGESFVEGVGSGDGIPLDGTNNWTMEMPSGDWVSFQLIQGDQGYFDILGLKPKQDNHAAGKWWLNEYAFKQLGLDEDAASFTNHNGNTFEIGGIYYDFKIRPLEAEQSAALIHNRGEAPGNNWPWTLLVKVTGEHKAASDALKADTEALFPDRLWSVEYLEDMISKGFADESRVLRIVLLFTLLSMLVSALGLFAMSSYYMQQEIRSVSVKKVFGAEYAGVLQELVKNFMKMVGVAFVIAVPVAWLLMRHWLDGYSHRIGLHWWIFAAAGLALATISVLSVLYQSIRTARTNPAEVLKKE